MFFYLTSIHFLFFNSGGKKSCCSFSFTVALIPSGTSILTLMSEIFLAEIISEAKQKANSEAKNIIEDAKGKIESEKEAALDEIKNQVAGFSIEIAEKILKKKLEKTKDQKDLINELIDEIKIN